jgi:hypothetical protein
MVIETNLFEMQANPPGVRRRQRRKQAVAADHVVLVVRHVWGNGA